MITLSDGCYRTLLVTRLRQHWFRWWLESMLTKISNTMWCHYATMNQLNFFLWFPLFISVFRKHSLHWNGFYLHIPTSWRQTNHVHGVCLCIHDDVIKWKHFPRYWPFVRWIHRSPVNFPHKSQWRGALMISLICVWPNGWVKNGEAGDLRRCRVHYDVNVMLLVFSDMKHHVIYYL